MSASWLPWPLPPETVFSVANTTALSAWIGIILLPRMMWLRRGVQLVAVGGLCLAYSALIQVHFFTVSGGGFGSLGAVQRLFELPEVALAGWLHYLAFDLFVGLWIAARSDALGISRWLQAPLLVVTFMFGPIGLLLFAVTAWARVGRGLLAPLPPALPQAVRSETVMSPTKAST